MLAIVTLFAVVVAVYERSGDEDPAGPEPIQQTTARACAAPSMWFTAERPIAVTEHARARIPVSVTVETRRAVLTARGESKATAKVTADRVLRAAATARRRVCAHGVTLQEAEWRATVLAEQRGRRAARRAALRLVRARTPAALKGLRRTARAKARYRAAKRARSAVPEVRRQLRRRAVGAGTG